MLTNKPLGTKMLTMTVGKKKYINNSYYLQSINYGRHSAKRFTYIILFSPHINPMI